MGKKVIYIIVAIIAVVAVVGGIFAFTSSNNKSEETSKVGEEQSKEAFVFKTADKEITLGEEFSIEKCGKENEYSEIASCAFEGLDKTYKYDNYEITTYPDNNKDKILSIYFLDETVSTTEGVKISDSYDDMVNAYGTNFEKESNKYTYKKGKTSIEFFVENEVVTSIEYKYDV